jgi:hypothetical protein
MQSDERYLASTPPPLQRERGFLLSAWLIFLVFTNGFIVYASFRQGIWLSAVWALFDVVSGIGTWLWFKVAFYGLLIGYGYEIAVALDNQSVNGVMSALIFMAITFWLVRQKWEHFR